jgi:hypothetical protein
MKRGVLRHDEEKEAGICCPGGNLSVIDLVMTWNGFVTG